jgi:hypothetical protein
MPAAKHLRPVAQGERVARKKSVADAAQSGDRRELLVAMRDRIAKTISDPDCPPRDLASLTRRLQDIAREIDLLNLSGAGAGSVVSDSGDEPFDSASV